MGWLYMSNLGLNDFDPYLTSTVHDWSARLLGSFCSDLHTLISLLDYMKYDNHPEPPTQAL